MANPVCFMDIAVDGEPLGRIEIVVRRDIVSRTLSLPVACSLISSCACRQLARAGADSLIAQAQTACSRWRYAKRTR